MTQRWITSAMGIALALSVSLGRPAVAFWLRAPKPGSGTAATATAPGATTTKVTGIIKGAPAGSTITVVSGRRTTVVDTSHASIRRKGRFASATALTSGSFVRAEGTMTGGTLSAKSIDILRPAGGNKRTSVGINGRKPAPSGTPTKP